MGFGMPPPLGRQHADSDKWHPTAATEQTHHLSVHLPYTASAPKVRG